MIIFSFQVCHGQGSTREASQTDAARRALVLLADSGELDNEDTNQSSQDNLFNGNGNNDSIPIVSAATASAAPPSENDNSCAWKIIKKEIASHIYKTYYSILFVGKRKKKNFFLVFMVQFSSFFQLGLLLKTRKNVI